MKKNMGKVDIAVRLLAAVIVLVLYFTHVISGTLAVILLVVAGILILTCAFGICPAYIPFGLSTLKKTDAK